MKKFLLITGAVVAGIVILSNLGSIILLAVSLALGYYGVRRFLMTDSMAAKVGWGIVVAIGLCMSLSNVPALIGIAALIGLYYLYKTWQQDKRDKAYHYDY